MTARLYLFAEGQTEQIFASTVVSARLAARGVFLRPPILIAHARKKRIVHRGGGRHYAPMKNDIMRFLRQDQNPDAFFTTMIDLYALHSDFPGRDQAERLRSSPLKRVEFLEEAFAHDIGDQRFIPYLQLHEFEACLFSDPEKFRKFYPKGDKPIAALKQIVGQHETPELIDDGQHTAPSKRITAEFPDYEDAKTVVGPQVAEAIGLDLIRQKCPHFNSWISRLESLGKPRDQRPSE